MQWMEAILSKPYLFLWYTIPVIMGLSLLKKSRSIDIQMHDTYYVISMPTAGIYLSILLGIMGILYWLTRNKVLINWMTLSHVISTILIFTLIIVTYSFFNNTIEYNLALFKKLNQVFLFSILAMVVSQIIFVLNLILSLTNS